jgi:hypothetical protein
LPSRNVWRQLSQKGESKTTIEFMFGAS